MPDWYLFVDESGNFRKAAEHVAMAGILVPGHSPLREGNELHRLIETGNVDCVPWEHLPWIHTAHVKVPVTLLLARYFRGVDDPEPPQGVDVGGPAASVRAMALELGEWLSDRPAVQGYLNAAQQDFAMGRLPPLETLQQIDEEVRRHHAALYARVSNFAAKAYAQLDLVIRTLRRDIRVIVTHGEPSNQWAGKDRIHGTARHFELMSCLFERASDVVARLRGQHRIFLKVAGLKVYEAGGPRHGVQLDVGRLAKLVGDLANQLPGNVRLQACEPLPFRVGVHGTLVAADFVVNRTWARRLLLQDERLAQIQRRFWWLPRHRIHSGEPPLSHLAATGWPESCVNAARHCAAAPACPPGVKTWAVSQAEAWADYLKTDCND